MNPPSQFPSTSSEGCLSRALFVRLVAMRALLEGLLSQFGRPFSLAVCGSAAFGVARDESDLELLLIVDRATVPALFESRAIRETFHPNLHPRVLEQVAEGRIDAVRLPEVTLGGVELCVNVYTVELCRRIAALEHRSATKYRDAPKFDAMEFRGFGWQARRETVLRHARNIPFEGGFAVETEIVHFDRAEPYFHIYVDKLCSAFLAWDALNIRGLQRSLYVALTRLLNGSRHHDPLGFLYNARTATPAQRRRLEERTRANDREVGLDARQADIVLLSGPSGVGKDTVIQALRERHPAVGVVPAVTTRTPRPSGDAAYRHVTPDAFLSMVTEDRFAFWHYDGAEEGGLPKYYGIERDDLIDTLERRERALISIGGTTAAMFLKTRFPSSRTIWLRPASLTQLRAQIERRDGAFGVESRRRLERLRSATAGPERHFDVTVLNAPGRLKDTIDQVGMAIHGAEFRQREAR